MRSRVEGVSQSTATLWTLARVYAGHPVTVYHGVILLKAIYFYCTISPSVTEWGQWQCLRYARVMRYVQKDIDTCLLLPLVGALHGACHNDGSLDCQWCIAGLGRGEFLGVLGNNIYFLLLIIPRNSKNYNVY